MTYIKWIAKAITAGIVAFGGAFATANVDGVIESGEWVAIAVTTIVAIAGVFYVPNGEAPE